MGVGLFEALHQTGPGRKDRGDIEEIQYVHAL